MIRTLKEHAQVMRWKASFDDEYVVHSSVVALEIADQIDALIAETERLTKEEKVDERHEKVDIDKLISEVKRISGNGDSVYLEVAHARAILARIESLEGRKDAGILAQWLGEAWQRVQHLEAETARLAGERDEANRRSEALLRSRDEALAEVNRLKDGRHYGVNERPLLVERDEANRGSEEQAKMLRSMLSDSHFEAERALAELAALRAAVRWMFTSQSQVPPEHSEAIKRAVEP